MKKADLVTGIVLLIFSLAYVWLSAMLPARHFEDIIEANVFPLTVGVVLALLSIVLIVRSFRMTVAKDIRWIPSRQVQVEIGFTFLALLLYVVLFSVLGYLTSTALFMCALIKFLDRKRALWTVVLLSLLVSGFSYFVFVRVFQTPMPQGILI